MFNVIRQEEEYRPCREESQQTREKQLAERIDGSVKVKCRKVVVRTETLHNSVGVRLVVIGMRKHKSDPSHNSHTVNGGSCQQQQHGNPLTTRSPRRSLTSLQLPLTFAFPFFLLPTPPVALMPPADKSPGLEAPHQPLRTSSGESPWFQHSVVVICSHKRICQ